MCVKLSLAITLVGMHVFHIGSIHPCATMRPRICDYNKFFCFFVFFGFFLFLMFFSQQHVRLKFRHKLPVLPIMNFYKDHLSVIHTKF